MSHSSRNHELESLHRRPNSRCKLESRGAGKVQGNAGILSIPATWQRCKQMCARRLTDDWCRHRDSDTFTALIPATFSPPRRPASHTNRHRHCPPKNAQPQIIATMHREIGQTIDCIYHIYIRDIVSQARPGASQPTLTAPKCPAGESGVPTSPTQTSGGNSWTWMWGGRTAR